MSKESRKAARAARESRRAAGTSRPAGTGSGAPGATGAAGGTGAAGSTGASSSGAGSAASTTRRSGSTAGARAGRRERVRTYRQPTFFERYRTAIISVVVVAVAAIGIGWIFLGSTAAAYTCGQQFNPSPTPTVEPGSSARLGFLEDDMGRTHQLAPPFNYLYCPPASGNHYNQPGVLGPIQPRVYKPDDKVGPPNWVHNLEHGGMVVLYRNDSPGASAAGLAAFQQFFDQLPPSPVCKIPRGALSPVIARFDQMPHAYAAIVWDRVMYMDTWDPDLVNRFYLEESERLDANGELVAPPEQQCAAPSPSAAPSASTDVSAAPSAAPSEAPSAAPSVEPSPSAS